MNVEQQRKAFDEWVLRHPDCRALTAYEENIMFDAWLAAQQQEGYAMVPINPNEAMHQAGQDMVTFGGGYDDIYSAMIEASKE